MKSHYKKYFFFVFALATFFSCKKNFDSDAKMQSPPETFMVVDKINRPGDLRMTTTVEAHWWGVSQAGIIKGFEYSLDNQVTWIFTKSQSGIFLLSIPVGKDTADVAVFVRAVDNLDQRDPTPASTSYPVKNTPPSIYFDYSYGRRTLSFPAFRYYWIANDTDGVADISGIEIAFNDTTILYQLPTNTNAATFEAKINSGTFSNSFFVYPNSKTNPQPDLISGIMYDSLNFFYVRCFDRSGARSKWTRDSIFIKKPKSDILLINDYTSLPDYNRKIYSEKLRTIGTAYSNFDSVDFSWDIFPSDNFTAIKNFNFYKKIIWVSNDAFNTLKIAGPKTTNFFINGGKMFMVIDIGGSFVYSESQVSFTPISSFVSPPNSGDQFKMYPGDSVVAIQNGWPNLIASNNALQILFRPFYIQNSTATYNYSSLYDARMMVSASPAPVPWTGQSAVIAKRSLTSTGETNLVFSAFPFNALQGNANLDLVFKKIIVDELKF